MAQRSGAIMPILMQSENSVTRLRTETYIDTPDGRVYAKTVGGGAGTPLLTLHGGPGVPHDALEPLERLAEDRAVVFYDQLGCGKSDRSDDASLWTLQRYVDEVDLVRRALALDDVHILGHSWGATLAVEYVLQHPRGVRSVIFADPAISVPRYAADSLTFRDEILPEDARRALVEQPLDSPEYRKAMNLYFRLTLCRLSPWPESMARSWSGADPRIYATMWGIDEFHVNGNLRDYDPTDRLGELVMPALFFCGRYDGARTATTADFASRVPRGEFVLFEESSHTPFFEEPERFDAVLRDFLRRADAAA
jgi:proline iminopeptidase